MIAIKAEHRSSKNIWTIIIILIVILIIARSEYALYAIRALDGGLNKQKEKNDSFPENLKRTYLDSETSDRLHIIHSSESC